MDWIVFGKIVSLFLLIWWLPVTVLQYIRGEAIGSAQPFIIAVAATAFIWLNGWLS